MIMDHSTVCLLFAMVFYLFIPLHGSKAPGFSPQCQLGDSDCLADFFTKVLQNANGFPNFEVPKLYPYVAPHTMEIDSVFSSSVFNPNICWSNFTVDGFEKVVVKEMRGFQPGEPNSEASIRLYFPKLRYSVSTKSDFRLYSTQFQTNGKGIIIKENVESKLILKNVVRRQNGKDYITISSISYYCNSLHEEVDFKYENIHPIVNGIVNRIIKENSKSFIGTVENIFNKYYEDFYKSIFTPIFNRMAIQDFYCMK